jgi:hypothetical protein
MKNTEQTVALVPPNDPEAVMIRDIAEAFDLDVIQSNQPHGAKLNNEQDKVQKIIDEGYEAAVIVELPGPGQEKKLRDSGVDVKIIDHHEYTDLDRAHDSDGERLPASLTQFLDYFEITDDELRQKGFRPRIVHGIALMDSGYVWELRDQGYSEEEIRTVIDKQDALMRSVRDVKNEKEKRAHARKIWEDREAWSGFYIIVNESEYEMRARVSLIIALEVKEPTPLILADKGRGFIYVQETELASDLFERFGGFTFGSGNNWGFKNAGKPESEHVKLEDVKEAIKQLE